MRKFTLINEKNQRFMLNGEQGIFLHSPEGLGIEQSTEFVGENGAYRLSNTELSQQKIQASFIFGNLYKTDAYMIFDDFIKFIQYEPLYLEYSVEYTTYKKMVKIVSLSKGEKQSANKLHETVVFDSLSSWYSIQELRDDPSKNSVPADGFLLPTIFPFTFGTLSSERQTVFNINNSSLYLVNKNSRMSPVKIKISAIDKEVVNPKWQILANSKIVANDGFDVTIPKGWFLEVSSLFQERTALLVDPDGNQSSVYQQQDVTKTGFVHVPLGESVIVFDTQGAQVECVIYKEVDVF